MPDLASTASSWSDEVSEAGSILDLLEFSRPAWHADAACREHRELSWFPSLGQTAGSAKEICASCLVVGECRSWAAAQGPELDGIWGGLSRAERAVERRQAA